MFVIASLARCLGSDQGFLASPLIIQHREQPLFPPLTVNCATVVQNSLKDARQLRCFTVIHKYRRQWWFVHYLVFYLVRNLLK